MKPSEADGLGQESLTNYCRDVYKRFFQLAPSGQAHFKAIPFSTSNLQILFADITKSRGFLQAVHHSTFLHRGEDCRDDCRDVPHPQAAGLATPDLNST